MVSQTVLTDFSKYFNRLPLLWQYFKTGRQELIALDCGTDSISFASKYEQFFICNLQYFQLFFGALFLILVFPILIIVGAKFWEVISFLGSVLKKVLGGLGIQSFTSRGEGKEERKDKPVKEEKKKPEERKKQQKRLRNRIFGVAGGWRYLREIAFFERSDENFGGPFWSVCFLLSTFITPFVGLSFLVPLQMIVSALFGFYTVYRVIRYKILLGPKMAYYWESQTGPGLYILVGSLTLLYGTVLFTAIALIDFFV